MKHTEIEQWISSSIPKHILDEYAHLSYGEMAEVPEMREWRDILLQAEEEWYES